MTGNTLVVVGLGNPGPGYAGNRHNVGQMVLDELASRMGATFKKHKTPNQVAEGRLVPGGTRLVLAKPGSFMNTSGGPVSSVLGFYSATPADLVVVHDELDLPFDTVRLKGSGGHGGHNGLRDIIKATGTNEFVRVRVGIGRPPGRQDPADYVLRDFAAAEKKTLPILLADAADAVEAIADVGLLAAQQRVHAPS
ncbi:aminoacyl-tRNA hydrolase [Curtobacterium sp. YC1]|uniref:aminoacyl-tRNA hydrolase n=1 Tax=Curtobacterium sp. YC1 TaxID=2795488 RepID=UPI0018E52B90|nr:aminoacyl-tRNA hydrolase [Curtobacterium sp. YC1]QQD76864.1 aminoacyl-tRNA hydrolase [Curtobacterium sp. YC1]